jgi:hypothetical protein
VVLAGRFSLFWLFHKNTVCGGDKNIEHFIINLFTKNNHIGTIGFSLDKLLASLTTRSTALKPTMNDTSIDKSGWVSNGLVF